MLKWGTRRYKLEHPLEYNEYTKDISGLQKKINEKINSQRFRSIRKILKKMLKVHFPNREDIEGLVTRMKLKNFDVS